MRVFVDAYAWIEYLEGSASGSKVRQIIQENEILSLSLTIAEVVSRVKRKGYDTDVAYESIIANSRVINISPEISKVGGLFHAEIRKKIKNFGLVDALLLAAARDMKTHILTGDHHFKGFKEAIFLADI